MAKNFKFPIVEPPPGISNKDWLDWKWQARNSLKSSEDFLAYFKLSADEQNAFKQSQNLFKTQTTPYYARLGQLTGELSSQPSAIQKISVPSQAELLATPTQQMLDPLGERRHQPVPRIVHRYPDRVLFWMTDQCSVYCRYCTRKHFTASNQNKATTEEVKKAIEYVQSKKQIREVIFSGGDPLMVSDDALLGAIEGFSSIPHVEIIRLGTRVPVVLPMRVTDHLLSELKRYQPIYWMTHFNHPDEISKLAAERLEAIVDSGFPVFNQMVLLNGVNNHPALVQALSRRLLSLRVKPYYMFQCDPSEGSDHLRTSLEDSLNIQRELWGKVSGLMMPNLSLDIPGGGGKVGFTPSYSNSTQATELHLKTNSQVHFCGFDGVVGQYNSPPPENILKPIIRNEYADEWAQLLPNG